MPTKNHHPPNTTTSSTNSLGYVFTRNSDSILDNVLKAIGRTPLVRLRKIPAEFGVECDIYVKCEFLNPGGSIEDRAARAAVEQAEMAGQLHACGTIIGTTRRAMAGIGLAMVAAVKGYHLVYILPEKIASQNANAAALAALRVLGVELVIVREGEGIAQHAEQLAAEKRANGTTALLLLDNDVDDEWAESASASGIVSEIFAWLGSAPGLFDCLRLLVLPYRTLAQSELALLKQKCPKCRILQIHIESDGNAKWHATNNNGLHENGNLIENAANLEEENPLNHHIIHENENFHMAQQMHRHEGILCGPCSGAVVQATLHASRNSIAVNGSEEQKRPIAIAILPDGIQLCLNGFEKIVKRNSDPQILLAKNSIGIGEQQHDGRSDAEFLRANAISAPQPANQHLHHHHHPHRPKHPNCHHHYDPTMAPEHFYQIAPEPWSRTRVAQQQSIIQRAHFPLNNIGQAIGETPLVRLKRLPSMHGIKAEILVKCEFLNAGGSVKDRAAMKMIEIAEASGVLRPGMTIIEPSSGNTGIAMAMQAAIKGYRCIVVMPEKMSHEKEVVMRSLGAQVVRLPSHSHQHNRHAEHQHQRHHHLVSTDKDPGSDLWVAQQLQQQIPESIVLDQYRNDWNAFAHYATTAEEIIAGCTGRLDAFVAGCGTGGTLSGIARRLKELRPAIKIVGVDPEGSTLSTGGGRANVHPYEVEGIGYDFVPAVLKHQLPDEWIRSNDANAFAIARQLIRTEGLLCGGSSGANVWAALQVAKGMDETGRVVTILPDGIRNYMSKFISDDWMRAKGFPCMPE